MAKDSREIKIDIQKSDLENLDSLDIISNKENNNDMTNIEYNDNNEPNPKEKIGSVSSSVEGGKGENKENKGINEDPNKYLTLDESIWDTIVIINKFI